MAAPTLSREARVRYARQISLPEIGEQGQLRLMHAAVAIASEAGSARTARSYLERAGVRIEQDAEHTIAGASPDHVAARAGDPSLEEAAAFLIGALDAVEAIKAVLGVGTPLALAETLTLGQEHSS